MKYPYGTIIRGPAYSDRAQFVTGIVTGQHSHGLDEWWVDTIDPNERPANVRLLVQPIEVLRSVDELRSYAALALPSVCKDQESPLTHSEGLGPSASLGSDPAASAARAGAVGAPVGFEGLETFVREEASRASTPHFSPRVTSLTDRPSEATREENAKARYEPRAVVRFDEFATSSRAYFVTVQSLGFPLRSDMLVDRETATGWAERLNEVFGKASTDRPDKAIPKCAACGYACEKCIIGEWAKGSSDSKTAKSDQEYIRLTTALFETAGQALLKFGDEYEGRLGPLRAAHEAFAAFLVSDDSETATGEGNANG